MKKKLVVLMIGLSFMLSACGEKTKVIEGEVKTTGNQTAEQIQGAETEDTTSAQEETEKYKGYVFIYNDIVIEIDAKADSVIEQLGEPDSYFEYASCAFEGLDKMYTYSSFEIDTYPMEEQDYISAIVFKDDVVTTREGIGIGDSVEKIRNIYGEKNSEESGMLVYEKDDMKLCFIIQEGEVVSIEYRSTVLDVN